MKAIMNSSVYNRIIAATKGFIDKTENATRPAYRYIKMDFFAADKTVIAVAVDGYKMSVEKCNCSSVDEDFTAYVKPNTRFPKDKVLVIETDGKTATIRCGDVVFGYIQPKNAEFLDWQKVLPKGEPAYKIGFDPDFILTALQAAKASAGGAIKSTIIFEVHDPTAPALLKTSDNTGVKMVLPVRIGRGDQ